MKSHIPLLKTLVYFGISKLLIKHVDSFYETVPDTLELPTSSTGKYHKDLNGNVPTTLDHTLEMLGAVNAVRNTFLHDANVRFFQTAMVAVACHDGLKYGWKPGKYTVNNHPALAATHMHGIIKKNPVWFTRFEGIKEFRGLICMIAYHAGPWTKGKIGYPEYMMYPYNIVHLVDMMSGRGILENVYKRNPKIKEIEYDR